MNIRQITWGSNEYNALVQLRIDWLLQPINIPSSYIVPGNEKNDLFIAAFDGEKLVGGCVLTDRQNGVAQLRQMVVSGAEQGKGIGAAILHFAEKLAREHHFVKLMMHARNPVLDFYRKSGYEISGEEFFEVGMGHHRMEKSL